MKTLLIIVPEDSLLSSYLQNTSNDYDNITVLEHRVCYLMSGLSHPMEKINYFIDMFMLSDFYINCHYGEYILRVRS